MSETLELSGTLNGMRARNASSSCFSLDQLTTAGTSSRASTRFSATVIAGTRVKCWYTMPRTSAWASAHPRKPLGWMVIAHDAFDEGALACAVFTEQGVEGPGTYLQIDIVQGDEFTEAHGHGDGVDAERPARQGRFADDHDKAPIRAVDVATAP